MTKPFIEITSDYGWIGPLAWINTNTMSHPDGWGMGRYVRRWGGIVFGYDFSWRFWEEVDA